jgi:mannosyltransferase
MAQFNDVRSPSPLLNQPWFQAGLLLFLTLCAAGLRLYKLGEWSFWIDEIYTLNHAVAHFSSPELILQHIPPARNWVPVSVILTAQAVGAWGISEWNARFVSALVGILSIVVFYFPVKRMFGTHVALVAMLLLAIAPWHIYWSQNARFYTSLLLFYSLALFAFYFAIEQDRPLFFGLFYVLFYFAMSERMIAIVLFPIIAAYLLVLWIFPIERPRGFRVRNLVILSTPIIVFLLLQLILFAVTGAFIFSYDIDALAPPIDSPIRLLIIIAFSIGVPLLLLGFFSSLHLISQRDRAGIFIFIAAVIPPALIALASPFFFIVERYAFVSLLFWIILAAVGISRVFSILDRRGIALAIGIFAILLTDAAGSHLMYYQINHGDRLNWREVTGYVRERKQSGDLVVSTRAKLASYYLAEEALEYDGLLPKDFTGADSTIWFILDYPGIWHGSHTSKAWIEDHAELLKFSFLRVREENSLLIYRYRPGSNANP